MTRRRGRGARVGLALAGGGPLGAIYEIGALCALAEALPGLDFARLDGYVGVSAGAFLCAGLANGMSPRRLCAAFIENEAEPADGVAPSIFLRPAWREFRARAAMLPRLAARATHRATRGREGVLDALEILAQALPTGLFDNAVIEARLREAFSAPGRTDDFRRLGRRLVLLATDLDTGEDVAFGTPGWDDVPISRAVTASAALPGLYPPVTIRGRHVVDGALRKTLHARVLLEDGIDLVIAVNPLVPLDMGDLAPSDIRSSVAGGGLPRVAGQTLRTLVRSRLEVGLRTYRSTHPRADVVLFEPERHDPEMAGASTFRYAARRRLAEHAYQTTRTTLRSRQRELASTLARHGVDLDEAAIADTGRRLLPAPTPTRHRGLAPTLSHLKTVLEELQLRLA